MITETIARVLTQHCGGASDEEIAKWVKDYIDDTMLVAGYTFEINNRTPCNLDDHCLCLEEPVDPTTGVHYHDADCDWEHEVLIKSVEVMPGAEG